MKLYIINMVVSEGFYNGSESKTFFDADPKKVISEAYEWYSSEVVSASDEGNLDPDCDILTKEEFAALMEEGFTSEKNTIEGHFALLQMYDSHQQFEPLCLDLGPNVVDTNSFIATKL